MSATQPRQHFYTSQRLRLSYWTWGDPDRPSLLCLHGGSDHARSWDRIADALSDTYYVVAPDLRGHGDSEWAVGSEYTTSQNVVDLIALIDLFDGPVRVLAHSFGGHIAFLAAGTYPERFRSIIAIEGSLAVRDEPRRLTPDVLREYVDGRRRMESRSTRRYPDVQSAAARVRERNRWLSPDLSRHITEHALRPADDGEGHVWKFDNWSRYSVRADEFSLEEAKTFFARIDGPLLYIVGDESGGKRGMERAAEHFSQGRTVVVPGAGHWVHHDDPEFVIRTAREFFASGPLAEGAGS